MKKFLVLLILLCSCSSLKVLPEKQPQSPLEEQVNNDIKNDVNTHCDKVNNILHDTYDKVKDNLKIAKGELIEIKQATSTKEVEIKRKDFSGDRWMSKQNIVTTIAVAILLLIELILCAWRRRS